MTTISSADSTQGIQSVISVNSRSADAQVSTQGTDFESWIRKLLQPDASGKVSEQELFSGVIQERLYSLKGEDTANQYGQMLKAVTKELKEAGESWTTEEASNRALKRLRLAGVITREEAHTIRDQAYLASQLDSNPYRLMSGERDPDASIKVTKAVRSALDQLELIDAGQVKVMSRRERRIGANELRRLRRENGEETVQDQTSTEGNKTDLGISDVTDSSSTSDAQSAASSGAVVKDVATSRSSSRKRGAETLPL